MIPLAGLAKQRAQPHDCHSGWGIGRKLPTTRATQGLPRQREAALFLFLVPNVASLFCPSQRQIVQREPILVKWELDRPAAVSRSGGPPPLGPGIQRLEESINQSFPQRAERAAKALIMLPTAATRWLTLPSYVRVSFAVDSRFDAVMCGACLLVVRAGSWLACQRVGPAEPRGEGGCSHPPGPAER